MPISEHNIEMMRLDIRSMADLESDVRKRLAGKPGHDASIDDFSDYFGDDQYNVIQLLTFLLAEDNIADNLREARNMVGRIAEGWAASRDEQELQRRIES